MGRARCSVWPRRPRQQRCWPKQLGIDTENTAKWLHEHRQEAERLAKIADLRAALRSPAIVATSICSARAAGQGRGTKWPDGSFGRASW